jgi:hypothetical protein
MIFEWLRGRRGSTSGRGELARHIHELVRQADARRAHGEVTDNSHPEERADGPETSPRAVIEPKKQRSVVLVHGTWPRGIIRAIIPGWSTIFGANSTWFDAGSAFRTQLSKTAGDNVDVEITSFLWSGSNSILERAEAARRFAAYLISTIEKQPDAQHVIIGHSHGGNVALRAMEYLGTEQASRFLFVALATPFVQLYESYLARQYLIAFLIIYIAIPTFFVVKVLIPLLPFLLAPDRIPSLFNSSGGFSGGVTLFVYAIFLGCISIFAIYRLCGIFISLLSSKPVADKRGAFMEAANYNVRGGPSILVIRGVYDEAALALAVGSGLTFISRLLRKNLIRDVATYSLLGAIIFSLPSLTYVSSIIPNWPGTDSALHQLEYGLVDAPFTIAVLLIILRSIESLGRSVFGREMALTSGTLELDVSAIPDCRDNVEVHTLQPEADEQHKGLRHGIYAHSRTSRCIHDWLNNKKERK